MLSILNPRISCPGFILFSSLNDLNDTRFVGLTVVLIYICLLGYDAVQIGTCLPTFEGHFCRYLQSGLLFFLEEALPKGR